MQRFLSQPFHVAEQFTGQAGSFVPVEETIASASVTALRLLGPSPIHRRSFAPVVTDQQLSLNVPSG